MKVKIGLTSGWEPGSVVDGWPLIYVNKGLCERLEQAGALPIIFPPVEDEMMYEEYLDWVDAVIVSGEVLSIKRNVMQNGDRDVLRNSNPLRYRNERAIIKAARKRNLPLLGICRGYQVLNVESGGTMKDGDVNLDNKIVHQQGGTIPPDRPSHRITISSGTRLHQMLNTEQVMVNSFHRQALDKLPADFQVGAVADDGNIEAIEAIGKWIAMGLQFHPEMLREQIWNRFFSEFIELIKKG
jgi:putative glutamine amidotransferase